MTQGAKEGLAIDGRLSINTRKFEWLDSMTHVKAPSAVEVIRSDILSYVEGLMCVKFLGGPQVLAVEGVWAEYSEALRATSASSRTLKHMTAVGAIGTESGEGVLLSPWTTSASTRAIRQWDALPVFADIDRADFDLGPTLLGHHITPRTCAIMSEDMFRQCADVEEINAVEACHAPAVTSDCAQTPEAWCNGRGIGFMTTIGGSP
jgi:perosamine synthetase